MRAEGRSRRRRDVGGAKPLRTQRIETGNGAHAFRAWGDKRHVLVSNRAGNTISRIDLKTWKVVANYPAPGGPDCMDLLADGRTRVYGRHNGA